MENDNDLIDFYDVSVEALSRDTREKLSGMLNRPKVLLSPKPNQFPRDYRGLGDLMGVTSETTNWSPNDDHVQMLLSLWLKRKKGEATLGKLRKFLGLIDRFDVLDDTHEMFDRDARNYPRRDTMDFLPDQPNLTEEILTLDDVRRVRDGLSPQIYDAYILYVSADEEFAKLLITTLEGPQFKLKLCDKDRDFLGGIGIEHSAIIKVMSKRCRSVLVVLSYEFLQSKIHTHFVQLAQSMNDKRIIPCIYNDCPKQDDNFLNSCHVLDFRRSKTGIVNFWDKLHSSIVPSVPQRSDNMTVQKPIGSQPCITTGSSITMSYSNADLQESEILLPNKSNSVSSELNKPKFSDKYESKIATFFKIVKKKKLSKKLQPM